MEGAQLALETEDYERAAAHVSRYLRMDKALLASENSVVRGEGALKRAALVVIQMLSAPSWHSSGVCQFLATHFFAPPPSFLKARGPQRCWTPPMPS